MARAPPLPLLLVTVITLTRVRIAACQGTNLTVSSNCSTTYSLLPPGYDIAQNFDTVVDLQRSAGVVAARTADQCCAQCTLSALCGAWVFASNGCTVKAGTVSNLQKATTNDCSICTRGGIRIVPGQANIPVSKAPAPAPAIATSAGNIDLSSYDLYGKIRIYKALSGNQTSQASSLWSAVNYTSGAMWTVAAPHFQSVSAQSDSAYGYFGESIYPDSNAGGCMTVSASHNASSSGIVLRFADKDSIPLSGCTSACTKSVPLASGFLYNILVNNTARSSYKATLNYTTYPTYHPTCIGFLNDAIRLDPLSRYLIDQPGTTPVNGSQPVLGSYHYIDAGLRTIVAAFDNITCLKFAANFGTNVTSITFSLYDGLTIGLALRTRAGNDQLRPLQASIQCSFGSQRNTSLPSCDAGNGTYASATKLSQTTRYFLVAENGGNQHVRFYVLKNFYAADTCQVRGPFFSVSGISTADLASAQQETASKASGMAQAISQAIATDANYL